MPQPDRVVAGLACRDVLADLSAYLDGELPAERVSRIQAHLAGCDWCERFGGEFTDVVRAFRAHLKEAEPVNDALAARLRAHLDDETGGGPAR